MLFSKPKSHIGVDIGTSNIKIVQLHPKDDKFALETYGVVNVAYQISSKDSATAINQTAEILKNLITKSRATTNKIVASLPNSVVFTSVIEMPQMPDAELKSAIEFEAKKYVPLPLTEVALSWSIIQQKKQKVTMETNLGSVGKQPTDPNKNKILLTAVPNVVVENYLKVFRTAGLEPLALEIEALSLIRSLVNEDDKTILLIDIGAKNTSINLVDNGYLRFSKNLNVGGDTVTTSIAQSLSVNFVRAEQFKKDFGLTAAGQQIPQVIKPILDIVKNEAHQLVSLFESKGERIDQILLSGAGSKLPSLKDYFGTLGKPVLLANPWANVIYPPELKPVIEPLALNLAVAVGLGMRKF
ncbi:MAG TPA: type IV pilus assembly protein PilM [Verrucomicrobiae bacterium]|nr:type IV pilus assembly protein PilM [Verrucomicrobiae bacterium]